MTELVAVRVRDCPDGTHPEGDSVWIRSKLSLDGGMAATADMIAAQDDGPRLMRLWMVTFVRFGAVSWDLHDEGGEVWPFDVELLLDDFSLAWTVADRADDLYRKVLIRPLPTGRPLSSPSGATAGSISKVRTPSSRRSSSARGSAGQRSAVNP